MSQSLHAWALLIHIKVHLVKAIEGQPRLSDERVQAEERVRSVHLECFAVSAL